MDTRASIRDWRALAISVLIGTALASCTSSTKSVTPSQILSPAPRPTVGVPPGECYGGIIRADSISAERLTAEMDGHVPFWLPPGFGLLQAWEAETESSIGEPGPGAIWADAGCRLVILRIYPGEIAPSGETRVGPWIVTQDSDCFFAPVGEQRCVDYRTSISDRHLSLWTFALTDEEAERVLSNVSLD